MVMTCRYYVLALLWFDSVLTRRPPKKQRREALARLQAEGPLRRWQHVLSLIGTFCILSY